MLEITGSSKDSMAKLLDFLSTVYLPIRTAANHVTQTSSEGQSLDMLCMQEVPGKKHPIVLGNNQTGPENGSGCRPESTIMMRLL